MHYSEITDIFNIWKYILIICLVRRKSTVKVGRHLFQPADGVNDGDGCMARQDITYAVE